MLQVGHVRSGIVKISAEDGQQHHAHRVVATGILPVINGMIRKAVHTISNSFS